MINLPQYLHRIQYQGDNSPTLETLTKLQRQHLLTVPFENLDIHQDVEIKLDAERIFQKVVGQNRGGFCYELNGLFHFLLVEMEFEVERISARVYGGNGVLGPEFDHLVNKVRIDGEDYLTDVGFGDFPLCPIPLKNGAEVEDRFQTYRLNQVSDEIWMLSKANHGASFTDKYQFTLKKREYEDYTAMCQYHQTSPDSHFTKNKICTICTPTGRITLGTNKLIRVSGMNREELAIKDDEEYRKALWDWFGVCL